MPEVNTLIAFGAAAYLFALFPGPAVLYIVTRSIEQGRNAGVVSVTGLGLTAALTGSRSSNSA